MTGRIKAFISILLITSLLMTFPPYRPAEAGAVSDALGIENSAGGVVTDNTFDYVAGKLAKFGTETGNFFNETGNNPNVMKYRPERAAELISQGNRIANLSQCLRGAGQVLNIYNTGMDTYKLFTEKSKHETTVEKVIDKGLLAIDVGMGWYAIGAGAVALFTAPAWGAGLVAAAAATGTAFLVAKIGVGLMRAAFNSEAYRDFSARMRGKDRAAYDPFDRPGMKRDLAIIREELGFDLYPGLRREIPDPNTGIPVYKPNIYLYSDMDIEVNVRLYPEHWITVSDPVYPPGLGWTAEIKDGSLNGSQDYLFYEALVPEEGFQKEEAFAIRGGRHKEDMERLLQEYGFTPVEINDFLDYWLAQLDGSQDYLFYPQLNLDVDRVMPLVVTPAPDSIFRLWFLIVPDRGEDFIPAKATPMQRKGFTLVEWGGILPGDS